MQKLFNIKNGFTIISLILITLTQFACKKLIQVDAPVTGTSSGNVYTNDATADAVLIGLYGELSSDNSITGSAGFSSVPFFTGLSGDELTLFDVNSNEEFTSYYRNDLTRLSVTPWNNYYQPVYTTNAAIEGISASTTLSPNIKKQLLGEAKFMRAFLYFYLVNLYGDVPLAVSTDYKVNSMLSRSPKDQVYQQIIADLKDAEGLMQENYLDGDATNITTERVRPTKWAASALLARAYLYTNDYVNAEKEATMVIEHSTLYSIVSLNDVFLANSREAIWQLQSVKTGSQSNTSDGAVYILPAGGPSVIHPVYLNQDLYNSFEPGDLRQTNWINTVTVIKQGVSTTYPYAYKYKVGTEGTTTTEYSTLLRLGEQYLIRAEARIQLNNVAGGVSDLNVLRNRARAAAMAGVPDPLPDLEETLSKTDALKAVLHERRVELFTEWGHRWFDLKRTGEIEKVMPEVAAQKGGSWNSNKALYPIPDLEISRNPSLAGHQNPGY